MLLIRIVQRTAGDRTEQDDIYHIYTKLLQLLQETQQ